MASFFQRFNIDDNQITETAKNKHKRLDCQTLQFFHVQIQCACQCIMTLPPKILWPTALLNTWTIITFPKSSFYHTNHTFLKSINVWMMDFWSINARIKKISSARNTSLCREWLLQKLTFHHNEKTIFKHSQYPNQRTFGEPPAPSVYIYIHIFFIYIDIHWKIQKLTLSVNCFTGVSNNSQEALTQKRWKAACPPRRLVKTPHHQAWCGLELQSFYIFCDIS